MKIISRQPYTPSPVLVDDQWWIGRQGICTTCGTVIELEAGDEVRLINPNALYATCPNPHTLRDVAIIMRRKDE